MYTMIGKHDVGLRHYFGPTMQFNMYQVASGQAQMDG